MRYEWWHEWRCGQAWLRHLPGAVLTMTLMGMLAWGAGGVLPVQAAASLVALDVAGHRIRAERADTPQTRAEGLMYRESLAENRGMLFVFEATEGDGLPCMWMRNTLIPLSVAFIDAQGRILNIEEMQPQTDEARCAARPARYALEMNAGWFAKRGIAAGAQLEGLTSGSSSRAMRKH